MGNPIKSKKLGGWFTDLKNVTGDAITGTAHVALETSRGAIAVVTGDFDRASDKFDSVVETGGQAFDTTTRIAGNIYDDAFGAKQALNAPPRTKAYKKGSVEDPNKSSPWLLAGLAIAAKFVLFK